MGLRVAAVTLLLFLTAADGEDTGGIDKAALKQQVYEMFMHGYQSYMQYAWPADELMPLSCKGRVRGVTPSRGDVDDSLGNFSLTLIDTLDTLIVVGAYDEFEKAVGLIVQTVRFDSDLVVSVFETNIRVLGGLISGHLMAELLRGQQPERLKWYNDRQLLNMAVDLADRLLPAFNTTSGLPFSRINLRHGMQEHLRRQKDTCTACGGTMLLEMAALSRLTGKKIYEEKAHKAMDFLWGQRHRASDLMGTVLDVHNGAWVRRDSGIGAGIDSYYEYCLKAYILLGDVAYLDRFNRHYDAVMRYVNKGPLFFDVQMHRPTIATRSFMDSLLAFWPGLQVLKGDLSEAVQMHEMLFQVVQKHKFLPEAFTHDLQVHWAEHPLRPEFIESTYFLYRATRDPHYLEVAKTVMDSLNAHVRVKCGWAGVKDIRIMTHEDRMDSFVLSETFKYLYLIFADSKEDLIFDPDNYVLTTEAHFLPLNLGDSEGSALPRRLVLDPDERLSDAVLASVRPALPLTKAKTKERLGDEARAIREKTQNVLEELATLQKQGASGRTPQQVCTQTSDRLRAVDFVPSNQEHLQMLEDMGITMTMSDENRILLTHQGSSAKSVEHAKLGIQFMSEMVELSKKIESLTDSPIHPEPIIVQLMSPPHLGAPRLYASIAQFGSTLPERVIAQAVLAEPIRACAELENPEKYRGRIVVVERSDCLFVEKARRAQEAGAVGVIVIDHLPDSAWMLSAPFSMSGEKGKDEDVFVPTLFLYSREGKRLIQAISTGKPVVVSIGRTPLDEDSVMFSWLSSGAPSASRLGNNVERCTFEDGLVARVVQPKRHSSTEDDSLTSTVLYLGFRFGPVSQDSEPIEHQGIVERHINHVGDIAEFEAKDQKYAFENLVRSAGYLALGLSVQPEKTTDALRRALQEVKLQPVLPDRLSGLTGRITRIRCTLQEDTVPCMTVAG